MIRLRTGIPILGMLLALAGCGGSNAGGTPAAGSTATRPPATAAPAAQTTPTAADPGAGGSPALINPCDELRPQLAAALGVEVALAETPFTDILNGITEPGCQLTARGTGQQFGSLTDAARKVAGVVQDAGWVRDPQYDADGPTATAGGWRRAGQLLLTSVEWQPGPAVSCPADQPIGACDVPPDQQMFTITINAALVESAHAPADFDAVEAGVRAGAPPGYERHQIHVQQIEGDYARAYGWPPADMQIDPAWFFLRRSGASWGIVAGPGTAFGPDDYSQAGIPEALWLGGSGEDQLAATALAYVKDVGGLSDAQVALERMDAGYARMRIRTPQEAPDAEPTYLMARQKGGEWEVLLTGAQFGENVLSEWGFPESVIPR